MGNPKTKYAKSGDISIAYQVVGDGPMDVIYVPAFISHADLEWEDPDYAEWMTRLSGFCRLILFDKRGTGLSDRDVGDSTLEDRMDDLRAVLDAVGSHRCTVIGNCEGGALAMLFAATFPERVSGLILFAATYCVVEDSQFPASLEQRLTYEKFIAYIRSNWGEGHMLHLHAPSKRLTADMVERSGRWERAAASPRAAINYLMWQLEMDARPVAKNVRVPMLVMHCPKDRVVPVAWSRWLAENVQGTRYIEVSGDFHWPWFDPTSTVLDAIKEFVTGERSCTEVDRTLATVIFTDIVGSTERAVALGDQQWRNLLVRHHAVVRRELARYRGRELDTAGDGFFAAFEGPARAIRCASAIADAVKPLGIEIRAGVHTGECTRTGDKLTGIAVHICARVLACAGPGEVWVSSTVRDLVAGAGLNFRDCGTRPLKGIPGEWRLFALA